MNPLFRTYQVMFNRLLMCMDAIIVVLSVGVAWYLKFDSGWIPYGSHYPVANYTLPLTFAVAMFLVSNWMVGLYRPMRAKSMWSEFYNVAKSAAVGTFVLMAVLYFVKMQEFSRDVLLMFSASFFLLTIMERMAVRSFLRYLRRRGLNQKYVLLVGWNPAVERFVNALEHQPWIGYRLFGYISITDDDSKVGSRHGLPCLGPMEQLTNVLSEHLIDQVIVALPRHELNAISSILAQCEAHGIQSLILPDYFDMLPARPRFETFGDIPLIDTRYVPLDDAMNASIKRVFDILFSLLVMIILSPVFVAVCIAVKLTSPGPVFFVQERMGKNRRVFKMYKFRTMRWESTDVTNDQDDDEARRNKAWTIRHDPRRTRFGAFLRRTSLDELPQFWNVLIGDMSVIGPRPERPYFVDQFREEVPRYMVKHRVRPGITGWAQVHGWRGNTSINERIQYDIEYIENWSFGLDMRIALRTLWDGFVNPHAY